MSRQSTFNQTRTMPKPKCAHCDKLGLPNDHWLRKTADPTSPVVCQVLLNTNCLFCHKNGHTISYCSEKKKFDTAKMKIAKQNERFYKNEQSKKKQPDTPVVITYGGKYGTLCEEDDNEETVITTTNPVSTGPTWSDIVKTQCLVPQTEDEDGPGPDMTLLHEWVAQKQLQVKEDMAVPKKPSIRSYIGRSWADVSDSDDE